MDKDVRKALRNILGLSKPDVLSTWARLCDEHRRLAGRGTDGPQCQHGSPRQNLPPVVVPAQPIAAGSAARARAAHRSSAAEDSSLGPGLQ